jgi:error-prone DNA polymerase
MYAELHCLSNFSFLRSASHPAELVERAAQLGYSALAITDECSLAGVVKAHVAVKAWREERGGNFRLIIGSEFNLQEPLTVIALAPDRTAYGELSSLITLARRRGDKGGYVLHLHELEHNLRHNLLIWKPHRNQPRNGEFAATLRAAFGDRLWLGISHLRRGDEPEYLAQCVELAQGFDIPIVACGDVAMHSRERRMLLDVVTAIRHNCSVAELGWRRDGNGERCLRSLDELTALYHPAWLQQSVAIAARCHFSLDELRYEYPPEVIPEGMTATGWLRYCVDQGAARRWPAGVPPEVRVRIDSELRMIAELQYEHYFLTVHDIVKFARDRNILCQGRGSAANSVVCYCLGITEVSPEQATLLFERFISAERREPPDIDVDFEHERREEVIQYIYKRYSRERAALTATVICYRTRSAIRDIGKALGLDPLFVQQLSESLAWWDRRSELQARFEAAGMPGGSRTALLFFALIQQLIGFPRHLSQHVGGFVISSGPLAQLVPVENATMPERTVIQWDKEDIEALGLMKVDVLALGMLTAIRKSLQLIERHHGRSLSMQDIPREEPAVYDMLCRADSIGVFQVESRAQMSMLPRLKPRRYYDLVVQVAIVRPGPIQGGMVHPYLRRRQGLEPIETDVDPAVAQVLARTLGIPIFQEQVIKLAMVAAGFTGGEADQLRRAMASWGKNGDLERFRDKLISGMLRNGHAQSFAERLFEQMKGFGAYGFPESHAASFALLVYVSAWLKHHYPAAFTCALLNSQPMGFYSSSQLVQDARRHGIAVRPIDIRYSGWDHDLEWDEGTSRTGQPAIRLGFRLAKRVSADTIETVLTLRARKPFTSVAELRRRARLPRDQIEALIACGALQGLSGHRHQAHWQALAADAPTQLEEGESGYSYDYDDGVELAAPAEIDELRADYNSTGLTLGRHPLALLREQHDWLRRCRRHVDLAELNHGRFVRIAGIVTGRQRPGTASGVVFVTLEDESGSTNVIVWRDLQQRCREALLKARLLLVKGVVEREGSVVHVIAGDLIDCSGWLDDVSLRSRDFH